MGVDVGGTKLLVVVVHPDGHVTSERAQPSPEDGPGLVAAVVDTATRLCGGVPAAVGVGAPALVDRAGVVRFSPHLPGLVGTELGADLRSALPGAALWVGNDA
ncbi:MAG: ROK family protein, partial [Acidimicrobiales bacterium]